MAEDYYDGIKLSFLINKKKLNKENRKRFIKNRSHRLNEAEIVMEMKIYGEKSRLISHEIWYECDFPIESKVEA